MFRCLRLTPLVLLLAGLSARADDLPLPNLADHHPATASSARNKTLGPENAVDGDLKTRWSTLDPKTPSWWMVDLGEPHELGGCQITWERKDLAASYCIEGSLDGKTWTLLSDQRGNEEHVLTQRLAIGHVSARYVRITIDRVEKAGFASMNDVRLFESAGVKQLPAADQATFLPDNPYFENIALNKPAMASSTQSGRDPGRAVDGAGSGHWVASDETYPQWWEVDLQSVRKLSQIIIRWESIYAYRFVVEGSADNIEWHVIADQRANTVDQQTQKFAVDAAARYLRVTVTGVDHAGSWASINEFKAVEAK